MRVAAALAVLLAVPDASWRAGIADVGRFELLRTSGPVRCDSLSPAGDFYAVYNGNDVDLVDLRKESTPRALRGHGAHIHDSGWSRDGRVYVTSGYDGIVRVWDTAAGRQLAAIAAHSGYA
jgi:WD40 repeat protein